MQRRRDILFLSHVAPAEHGIGVEQRAWHHLLALGEVGRVVVVVAMTEQRIEMTQAREPLDLPAAGSCLVAIEEDLRFLRPTVPGARLVRELVTNSYKHIGLNDAARARVLRTTEVRRFDTVFCFRMRSFPIWEQLQRECGFSSRQIVVDIDDIESKAKRLAIPKEAKLNGIEKSLVLSLDVLRTRGLEHKILSSADWALVCSEEDRRELSRRRLPARLQVVPNSVRERAPLPPRPRDDSFHIVIVGTMNYSPNADAAVYFCSEVWPRLKRRCHKTVKLWIVGHHPPEHVRKYGDVPGISVVGGVASVSPFYELADVAVVPIRHGGGTRIKILEAMAFGRAVVSTAIGAEGIECESGRDILIANSTDEIVQACLRLAQEPGLSLALVENARRLIREKYSDRARRESLTAVLGESR
jgi:glycosyltransferase involved in cell wall biosynthesis